MHLNPVTTSLILGFTFCLSAAFFLWLRLVWQSFLRRLQERQEEYASQLVERMIQFLASVDNEIGQKAPFILTSTAQTLEKLLTEERVRNSDASSVLRLEKVIHELERDRRP